MQRQSRLMIACILEGMAQSSIQKVWDTSPLQQKIGIQPCDNISTFFVLFAGVEGIEQ